MQNRDHRLPDLSPAWSPPTPKGAMEKRAFEYMRRCYEGDVIPERFSFTVVKKPSKTWGMVPVVLDYKGRKLAEAGGCGYCKISTVLSNLLKWLARSPEQYILLSSKAGTGVNSIVDAVWRCGWYLDMTFTDQNIVCNLTHRGTFGYEATPDDLLEIEVALARVGLTISRHGNSRCDVEPLYVLKEVPGRKEIREKLDAFFNDRLHSESNPSNEA